MGPVATTLGDADPALYPLDFRRRSSALILRTAEPENGKENDSQQGEPNSEACAFAEALRQIDAENNSDDEVNKRNEHQQNPPPWPADDLAPNVEIVDRDDAGPTRLARFGKYLPYRHNDQQPDEQSDDPRNGTAAAGRSRVIGCFLSQQKLAWKQEGKCSKRRF